MTQNLAKIVQKGCTKMSYEQSETLSKLIGAMNAKGIRYGIWKNLYEVSLNNDFEYDFVGVFTF